MPGVMHPRAIVRNEDGTANRFGIVRFAYEFYPQVTETSDIWSVRQPRPGFSVGVRFPCPTTYRYPILTFKYNLDREWRSKRGWESGMEKRTTGGWVNFFRARPGYHQDHHAAETSTRCSPKRTFGSNSTRNTAR